MNENPDRNPKPYAPRCAAVVLAGGRGSRLREMYRHIPKPFIPVAGRPFIERVFDDLRRRGATDVIVSLGHAADLAERYVARRRPDDLRLRTVRESSPLGTGGAILSAARAAAETVEQFVVVNGDTLIVGDARPTTDMIGESLDGVIEAVCVDDASSFGTLDVDADDRLRGYREKVPGGGWINAGAYVLRRSVLERLGDPRPCSWEYDLLPRLLAEGCRIGVRRRSGSLLDIGTPERLAAAEATLLAHDARRSAA